MWLFLEVRTLLPDQGNKEKIERVMNSIELALLDRISQAEIETNLGIRVFDESLN
ncbi:hypothetical protein R3W88_015854 [Solanum pinnatisectum]|uniref:Uncharacterized protein n=1 Tax=Solanum pinnatisectum TaxID=50273 RepID=A0AAV9KWY2_9SOLN|nr:hypothetical protein R3W88_015846 [Solanum pinnatisectum]KAK4717516.1 hypothetical protein R3W88_015854 [Solanum pinnatisectum]